MSYGSTWRPRDASGKTHHLAVNKKGFDGEELTIASAEALAYQDVGEIQDIPDFPGLLRDGNVPAGDRIYRLPYLDPKGRMTVAQWNTASFGADYRLAPLEARNETFTWKLPREPGAGRREGDRHRLVLPGGLVGGRAPEDPEGGDRTGEDGGAPDLLSGPDSLIRRRGALLS